MRHPISWTDLTGRRVGLWGLGTEGRAGLRKLRNLGVEPVIVDDAPRPDEVEDVLVTGAGGLAALHRCDVVVKTPGISRYRPEVAALEDGGVAVVGGLGLWFQEADLSRVVAVTGTKGKSTTTAMVAHLAAGLGLRVFAGGNLGIPPYDPEADLDVDVVAIEVSSYQATDVATSPPVVAVTSLHPDHLPWHRDAQTYFRDKLSLCTQPGAGVVVAAATSPYLVERAALLGPRVQWVDPDTYPDREWVEAVPMVGGHNLVNAGIARASLEALGVGAGDAVMAAAMAGFPGLDSRLEHVATVAGVDFFDDSLSTNVLSTLAAVNSFPGRRIALIAGGLDRAIDYGELAGGLARRDSATLVLTVYSTGSKIQHAVEELASPQVDAVPCADLAEAVRSGWSWAQPDGVVLLSPAAASFDAFRDYRHRGDVFRAAVAELGG